MEAAVLAAHSSASGPLEPASVIEVLRASVSAFDDDITHRFLALFPGGPEAISQLSDDDIRSVALKDGKRDPIIELCLAGSTVLIAILDPARQLYVVSLGDSIGSTPRKHTLWLTRC
jgi:pyruvate dehydrogenase phosphatase